MTLNKHYFCCMQISQKTDQYFMQKALEEAQKAFDLDEVPVGAIITCNNQIISRAYNYMEHLNDATALLELVLKKRRLIYKTPEKNLSLIFSY